MVTFSPFCQYFYDQDPITTPEKLRLERRAGECFDWILCSRAGN